METEHITHEQATVYFIIKLYTEYRAMLKLSYCIGSS